MSEKRKPQQRWHPLVFLAGWTAILIVGWIFSGLGLWDISWHLAGELHYFIQRNLYEDIPSIIKLILFITMGIAIPAIQLYLLNRSFELRLSWGWVVLTGIGNTLVQLISFRVVYLLTDAGYPIPLTMRIVLFIGISALLQGWILRRRWRYTRIWGVISIISGYFAFQLMWLFLSVDWIYFDYRNALELVPAGAAHGLLTGITAIALDWFTRKYPRDKKKPSAEMLTG